MPSGIDPQQLRLALANALPSAPQPAIDELVALVIGLAEGPARPDAVQAQLAHRPDLQALVEQLVGSSVSAGSALVRFEAGSQTGDVRMGDVAGGNIIKIIPDFAAAYRVEGLANPFLGLQPFTYADRGRYAGREALARSVARTLALPGEQQALLLISGPSGSGKSSFAQAGVLPALASIYSDMRRELLYAVMRPGRHPGAALADARRALGLSDGPTSGWAAPDEAVRVLVVDQLEELFAQAPRERRGPLLELLGLPPPFASARLHILATLRSDFLDEVLAVPALEPVFRSQLILRAMNVDELSEAIVRPVLQLYPGDAARIEPALLRRLAEDASASATYLPLLQVTLEDLWRRGDMRLQAYDSLTDAISRRAEEVYLYADHDQARASERPAAERRALLSLLLDLVAVSLDASSRADTRRRRPAAELIAGDPVRARLLDDLVAARLCSRAVERVGERDEDLVEIIHESLIANWARLGDTIEEQRVTLQRRARFELALAEWLAHQRDDGYLLGGVRLAEAQVLQSAGDIATRAGDGADLLRLSLAARDAARERQLRRTQAVAAALAVLLFAALAAGWYALDRGRAAQRSLQDARTAQAVTAAQLRISESQRLSFIAGGLREEQPETALLVAMEAVALDVNPNSESRLHEALDELRWASRELPSPCPETALDVRFMPDGHTLLAACDDGAIYRLNSSDGQPTLLARLPLPEDALGVLLLPDGAGAVTGSPGYLLITPEAQVTGVVPGEVRIWDLPAGTPRATLPLSGTFEDLGLAAGPLIVAQGGRADPWLWDESGRTIARLQGSPLLLGLLERGGGSPWVGSFSPPVSAAQEGVLELYSLSSSRPTATPRQIAWPLEGAPLEIAVSPNGTTAIVAVAQGSLPSAYPRLALISLDDASVRSEVPLADNSSVDVAYSPDSSLVAIAVDGEPAIQLWTADGMLRWSLRAHEAAPSAMSFSPDGRSLVSLARDGTLRLWDLAPLQADPRRDLLQGAALFKNQPITDGCLLAISAQSGDPLLIDWRSWQVCDDLKAYAGRTTGENAELWLLAATVVNGELRAVVMDRQGISVRDSGAAVVARLQGSEGMDITRGYQMSRDGGVVASTACDEAGCTARIWDGQDGTSAAERRFERPPQLAGFLWDDERVLLSPDGSSLVLGVLGTPPVLWSLPDNRVYEVGGVRSGASTVTAVAFSPEGDLLLTAFDDGSAAAWRLIRGQAPESVGGMRGIDPGAQGLSVTEASCLDGRRAAVQRADGRVEIWSLDDGQRYGSFGGSPGSSLVSAWARYTPGCQALLRQEVIVGAVTLTQRSQIGLASARATAACKVGRELRPAERMAYGIPDPPAFRFAARSCP